MQLVNTFSVLFLSSMNSQLSTLAIEYRVMQKKYRIVLRETSEKMFLIVCPLHWVMIMSSDTVCVAVLCCILCSDDGE